MAEAYRERDDPEEQAREAQERLRHAGKPARIGVRVRPPYECGGEHDEENNFDDALNVAGNLSIHRHTHSCVKYPLTCIETRHKSGDCIRHEPPGAAFSVVEGINE